jgi:hypothetical protein
MNAILIPTAEPHPLSGITIFEQVVRSSRSALFLPAVYKKKPPSQAAFFII